MSSKQFRETSPAQVGRIATLIESNGLTDTHLDWLLRWMTEDTDVWIYNSSTDDVIAWLERLTI